MAAATLGTCDVRRCMSQSTSSSMTSIVSSPESRNQRSTFKWPIHASAEPRVIVETFFATKFFRSVSVQTGWSGMVMSISVMFAASSRLLRRFDVSVETATIAPNWSDMSVIADQLWSI